MADLSLDATHAPTVVSVTFTRSAHPAVPLQAFPSIAAADVALAAALASPYRGPGTTRFVVAWQDGETHEGYLELGRALQPINLLRRHLTTLACWLASDGFVEAVRAFTSTTDIARSQAWGRALARRLDADLARARHPVAPGYRNGSWPGPARLELDPWA